MSRRHRAAGRGLWRYVRGHVHIVDFPRLEAAGCECHGVIQMQYARLLNQRPMIGAQTV